MDLFLSLGPKSYAAEKLSEGLSTEEQFTYIVDNINFGLIV